MSIILISWLICILLFEIKEHPKQILYQRVHIWFTNKNLIKKAVKDYIDVKEDKFEEAVNAITALYTNKTNDTQLQTVRWGFLQLDCLNEFETSLNNRITSNESIACGWYKNGII